ncbi:hypothetical protein C8Q76DRAFT_802884 [Earliella scabrosa]|nr:hypothetical protein C8Q76DRAFT_802884 [Earliella scabrosa]
MAPPSLSLPRIAVAALFCEAMIYGIYTVLAGGTLFVLLRKPRERRFTRGNLLMCIFTVAMYANSTADAVLVVRGTYKEFFTNTTNDGLTFTWTLEDREMWDQALPKVLNCILGDLIVCWRTWEIWERWWVVLPIPILCIAGGLAGGIGMVYTWSTLTAADTLTTSPIFLRWLALFGGFTFLTNLYSIVMISWKAWRMIRALKGANVHVSGRAYYSILFILIESGAVYCIVLLITVVLFLAKSNAAYISADIITHLTGIYPTIIIVLASLQMTVHDTLSRASTASSEPDRAWNSRLPVRSILSWRVAERYNTAFDSECIRTAAAASIVPHSRATTDGGGIWLDEAGSGKARSLT